MLHTNGGSAWSVGHSRTSSGRCGPTLSAVSEDGMSSETLSEVVHTQEILVTSPAKKVRLDLRRAFSRQLRERMIQALRGQNRTGIGSPPRHSDAAVERLQSRGPSITGSLAPAVAGASTASGDVRCRLKNCEPFDFHVTLYIQVNLSNSTRKSGSTRVDRPAYNRGRERGVCFLDDEAEDD